MKKVIFTITLFFMIGTPFYNEKKNQLESDDLEFELSTKKVIQKSMAWLFKKKIEKTIEEAMRYPLEENLKEYQQILNESLTHDPITTGIVLNGVMKDLTIGQTYVTEEFIHVVIKSDGQLELTIKDLGELSY